jgi:HSP20 family protein
MLSGLTNRSVLTPFERILAARGDLESAFNGNGRAVVWMPPMDVYETAEAIICQLEVPGMAREELEIRMDDKLVTIAGEKKPSGAQDRESLHHTERRYGSFERSFTIPANIDTDHIRARHENGVLTISLPKSERAKPRRISIEGSEQREIESK